MALLYRRIKGGGANRVMVMREDGDGDGNGDGDVVFLTILLLAEKVAVTHGFCRRESTVKNVNDEHRCIIQTNYDYFTGLSHDSWHCT